MDVVCLFGQPGAGKSTLAACFQRVDTPAVRVRLPGAETVAASGSLADDSSAWESVRPLLDGHRSRSRRLVVVDGFPRTRRQYEFLAQWSRRTPTARLVAVLLDPPADELDRRLANRRVIEGRLDDSPAARSERVRSFHRVTMPAYRLMAGRHPHLVVADGAPADLVETVVAFVDDLAS